MEHAITQLSTFLQTKQLQNKDTTETPSHVCMDNKPMNGSFNIILPDDIKLLSKLVNNCIKYKYYPGLLERPEDNVSPIKIDIDLHYDIDTVSKRQHDIDFIKNIVIGYNELIMRFLQIDSAKLNAYIFQRPAPYDNTKGLLKDGIHIMYPDIISTYEIQYVIREEFLKGFEQILNKITLPMNKPSDIIDKSVIKSNAWFLYGCTKKNTEPYRLEFIIDANGDTKLPAKILGLDPKLERDVVDAKMQKILIDKLSIRNHNPITAVKLTVDGDNELVKYTKKRPSIKTHNPNSNSGIEIEYIEKLISILKKERSNVRDDWINLGMALHNIDPCNLNLLNMWIEFSKHSKKYIDGECEKMWRGFKNIGLTMGSLIYWAKEDDMDAFIKIKQEYVSSYISISTLNSIDSSHNTLANILHKKFQEKFVCSSLKSSIWYMFDGQRWTATENGHALKIKIASELLLEFMNCVTECNKMINMETVSEDNKKNYEKKADTYRKTMNKLCDSTFQINIMKQCADIFYDPKFEDKLDDTYRFLIAFDNGVYDLKNKVFRNGRPSDYISFSTNIDYIPFDKIKKNKKKMKLYEDMSQFLTSIFPDKDVKAYMIRVMASLLDGSTKEQKIRLWLGDGANGKGKLRKLIDLAFGDYAKTIDVALFTRPHGDPKGASPIIYDKKGVRILWLDEPNEGAIWNAGLLKYFSGGDLLTSRTLYQATIRKYYPQFCMIIISNFFPEFKANDDGIWRRAEPVLYPNKFVPNPMAENEHKIDLDLDEKIETWKEVFMSMLIDEYPNYTKSGIVIPDEVIKFTLEYQKYCDRFNEFITNTIVKGGKQTSIKISDIFQTYKAWYKDSFPDNRQLNKIEFSKYLSKKFKKLVDIKADIIYGFRLRTDGDIHIEE
jgi:P4 family phage/plasmid primase-like protien